MCTCSSSFLPPYVSLHSLNLCLCMHAVRACTFVCECASVCARVRCQCCVVSIMQRNIVLCCVMVYYAVLLCGVVCKCFLVSLPPIRFNTQNPGDEATTWPLPVMVSKIGSDCQFHWYKYKTHKNICKCKRNWIPLRKRCTAFLFLEFGVEDLPLVAPVCMSSLDHCRERSNLCAASRTPITSRLFFK